MTSAHNGRMCLPSLSDVRIHWLTYVPTAQTVYRLVMLAVR